MDRHLFIMNSFLRRATLGESTLILFRQQSGTLEKQLLYVSFWCVLMVLISSGMLLAPRDSDVSATIAVRKHRWWIYNTQTSTYWPEKWLSICFWSKTGFIRTKNTLPKFPFCILMKHFTLVIIHGSCQKEFSQWGIVGVATEFRGRNQLNLCKREVIL